MIKKLKSLMQTVKGTPRAVVVSGNHIPDIRKTSEIYKKTSKAVLEEQTLDAKLLKKSREFAELHKEAIINNHIVEFSKEGEGNWNLELTFQNPDLDKIVFGHGAPKLYLNMLDKAIYASRGNEKFMENECVLAYAKLCEMLMGVYTHNDTKVLMKENKTSAGKTHKFLETLVTMGYKDVEKLLPPPKGNVDAHIEYYKKKAEDAVIISISNKSKGDKNGKQRFEHGVQVIHPLTNKRDYPMIDAKDGSSSENSTGDYDSGEFASTLAKEFSVARNDDRNRMTAEVLKALIEKYSSKRIIILYEESNEEAKNAKAIAKSAGIKQGQIVPIIERESLEKEVTRLSWEKPSFIKRTGAASAAALIIAGAFYGAYKAGTLKEAKMTFVGGEAEIPAQQELKKLKRKITIPNIEIADVKYDWKSKKLKVAANASDKDGITVLRGTLADGRPVFTHSAGKDKKISYDEDTKIELKPGKYNLKIKATDSQNDSGYATKEFEVVKPSWSLW